jgi:hypothetical protein
MMGGLSAWGLGEVLTIPLRKKHKLRITHKLRCFLWRQNNPEVNYSPTRISGGECFYRKYPAAVNEIGELAQDRDRWQALVGTVRDFRVP